MMDHTTSAAEFPPNLSVGRLPEEEIDASWLLKVSISDLASHHDNLYAALLLFNFCVANRGNISDTNPSLGEYTIKWQMMGARDGALSIYHFGTTMGVIKAALHKCPTIASWVDSDKLRTETKRFESFFPNIELMRHAIAHQAELMKNVDSFSAHAFTGPYETPEIKLSNAESVMVSNNLFDRKFVTTIRGQIISYELSQETCDRLRSVKIGFFEGFREAERQSNAMARMSE